MTLMMMLSLAGALAADERMAARYIDTVHGTSLEEAIARGLESEPGLLAARADLDAARGALLQAELRPNPSLTAARQEQISGPDNSTMVEVDFPLELFRRGSRAAAAERVLEKNAYSVADRERVLAFDIRTAYGNAASAARNLKVQDDLVAATRRGHELLRARVDEGAAPPLDRDRIAVELHRLESERLFQAAESEAALVELKRLLGVGPREPLLVTSTIEDLVSVETAVSVPGEASEAVKERADVREAEAGLRVAEARIEEALDQGQVDMSLFGSYTRADLSFPQSAFGPSGALEPIQDVFHYVTAGARLSLPLRNRNQGAVAAARAERAASERVLQARMLAAESEVVSAMARDERAREAVSIYASGARELAQQNLEVVRETYRLGRSTLSDVLIEQRRYLEIELGYTEALRAAFDARTALKRSLGEPR
jgi:cobalt-zinc-cadmium efflux system outer membrane protein